MKLIRKTNEAEMILEFLKGELNSKRFNEDLNNAINELGLDSSIILNGNIEDEQENNDRLKIMKKFRGYPDEELFERFPNIEEWKFLELNESDIDNIYYIDYDYWNELSNGTSKPVEAAKVIKSGKEIYEVSNQPFLDGVEYNKTNKFPPVILITCNNEKYLIIEGHSRMTVYGFNSNKLNGTYAYVGYTTEEEMKKYDPRMLTGEEVKTRKY
ncbi:MAG: hypothetical protein J6K21_01860 [Bacilli bacterium]|nr:hypothetical protein [Bacilli bacterium]